MRFKRFLCVSSRAESFTGWFLFPSVFFNILFYNLKGSFWMKRGERNISLDN